MRAFVTFAALPIGATALLLAWGCSSTPATGGTGGTGGSPSTSTTTSTTSSGSTTTSTATSSSGGPTGTFAYCIPSGTGAVTTCFAFPLGTDGGPNAATVCAADTEDDETWDPVSTCQSPSLTGCCEMDGDWQCFYDAADAGLSGECTSNGGTWSATSP